HVVPSRVRHRLRTQSGFAAEPQSGTKSAPPDGITRTLYLPRRFARSFPRTDGLGGHPGRRLLAIAARLRAERETREHRQIDVQVHAIQRTHAECGEAGS